MSDASAVVLSGLPAAVSGLVPFHNATAQAVIVEEVVIHDPAGSGATRLPIQPVTVPVGETVRIAVELAFQPQTEPGAHPVDVEIAGVSTTVIVHVAEGRSVAISPESLVVDNVPDAATTKTVGVSNQGNVPVFVADFGELPAYREDEALAAVQALARTAPELGRTAAAPLPEPAASLAITTAGGRVEVPPGETRIIELTVTLPPDLAQSSRYLVPIPIAVRTLVLVVVPAGSAPDGPS